MKINNSLTQQLLEKVKVNKKYRTISDDIIKKEVEPYLKFNPKIISADRQTIKEIRAKLHRIYSSYQTKKKRKRDIYLNELSRLIKNNENIHELTNKLLSLTISTKERLEDYQYIYKNIFKITGKPKTIIDLGCGLNPLSYTLMNLKSLTYYCYDIDQEDINFLNSYFKTIKNKGLSGRAEILDIRDINKIKNLLSSDIIFMFKLFDLLDKKTKKQIIPLLMKKTNHLIISFATKTLTRRPMKLKRRTGFENYLKENNLKFETIKTQNEIFYIINNL